MGIQLAIPPESEPITLDEACAHCRVSNDTEDGLIAGYILAAREFAEANTRRTLMKQTFDYTLDFAWPLVTTTHGGLSYYRTRIELPKTPVLSVDAITYIDTNGAVQTLSPGAYTAYLDDVVPYVEPAFEAIWPTPRYQPQCATVRFTAGYGETPASIPETIRMGMLMLVDYWYGNRGDPGDGGKSSLAVTNDVPPAIQGLFGIYRQARILS